MSNYAFEILGVQLSFRTDASSDRIEKAVALLEERYGTLSERGRSISKEKLLIFLALGLADDLLQVTDKVKSTDSRIEGLLHRMDNNGIS
ncbi:MAG: cell division protein ZapA [Deltaproteobacteria bacterium]|nr:cell division protein ZapA [Deltaproteobacteria bacterium]